MASRGAGPLRAALIEVCEELRLRVARDRDGRAARLDEVVDERERPRGRPLERVVGRVLDAGALEVVVAIEDLDVPCAAFVCHPPDGPDQWQVLRVCRYPQELPGLEVDGDLDRKACIPVEPLVRRHRRKPYSLFAKLSIVGSPPKAPW